MLMPLIVMEILVLFIYIIGCFLMFYLIVEKYVVKEHEVDYSMINIICACSWLAVVVYGIIVLKNKICDK